MTTVWFNGNCSKCRGIRELLAERGIVATYRPYLEDPPSVEELEHALAVLGLEDPSAMMRKKETAWSELGLDEADRDTLLRAMASHPQLIERPILFHKGQAVIARPTEKALPIL